MTLTPARSTTQQWVRHHQVADLAAQDRFQSLTPETVRPSLVEAGFETTGPTVVYESWENRVYGFTTTARDRIVAKIYRPERWSRAAIEDEITINRKLVRAGLPVVQPLPHSDGTWLGTVQGMSFAVFAHLEGQDDRYDDWTPADTRRMGRAVAELHEVMADCSAPHRLSMHPTAWAEGCVQFLESTDWMPTAACTEYSDAARTLIAACAPALESLPYFPIHGDLGINNVMWTPNGPLILDLDDMVNGPAIQDLVLLHVGVNGAGSVTRESRTAYRERLADGYREVRLLPADQLALCEPLFCLRLVWMDAWVASRWHDPVFQTECADRNSIEECRIRAEIMREAAAHI